MGTLRGKIENERTIMELQVGEEGWTSPDSLEIHVGFDAYLYLEEPVYKKLDEKKGITLYLKRYGEGKDDFFVDIEKIKNYSWEKVYLDKEDFEDALTDPRIAILEYKNEPETKLKAQPKTLEEKLKEAEINEDYEKAAKLRDKIKSQPHTKNSSQ